MVGVGVRGVSQLHSDSESSEFVFILRPKPAGVGYGDPELKILAEEQNDRGKNNGRHLRLRPTSMM